MFCKACDVVRPTGRDIGWAYCTRTSEGELPDELVPADGVEVHDLDVEGAVADLLPGDVEVEGGVEDRVEVALVHRRLLLLHPLVAEHQPHLHVRVCVGWGERGRKNEVVDLLSCSSCCCSCYRFMHCLFSLSVNFP